MTERQKFIWLKFYMALFTFLNSLLAAKRYGNETFRPGVVFILCGLYLISFAYVNIVQPMFRQKNTRSAGTRTGKVINIENKSKKRVTKKRRNVNVI